MTHLCDAISVCSPRPAPEPSAGRRLALQLKENGNVAFKSEEFSTAINLYSRAIGKQSLLLDDGPLDLSYVLRP